MIGKQDHTDRMGEFGATLATTQAGQHVDQPITVTSEILEGYLSCRYKAYLRLSNEVGMKSDYEAALATLRREVKLKALDKLQDQYPDLTTATGINETRTSLSRGDPLIADGTLSIDGFCVRIDLLRKVIGHSSLGNFHYEPLLFHEGPRVRQPQRLLLASLALLLSRAQGKVPNRGVIYHGGEATASAVHVKSGLKQAGFALDELDRMRRGELKPAHILNDHCGVCEFRRRCRDQAIQEDNLSLLRGIGKKDIRTHGRRGILTLTQLAHTFRPRRSGKRSDERRTRRYYALQALSIRDRRIYVLGTPRMQTSAVRIYLDLEGNPYDGYIYLIGMIIRNGDREDRRSFWANSRAEERVIFEQFLAVVAQYDSPTIFCYGEYEKAFLRRMRHFARSKKAVDRALDAVVNILSLIHACFYFPTYTNGLKEIAGCLDFSWSNKDASSAQSIAWRIWWNRTHDDLWKTTLVEYNLEDCAALQKVVDFIEVASAEAQASQSFSTQNCAVPPMSRVEELAKLVSPESWGGKKFAIPDYKFVNDHAYFDYQRQRVFVRANKKVKKHHRKPGSPRNRSLRAVRIVAEPTACSACRGRDLVRINAVDGRRLRTKRAFDLQFLAGSIKRRVIDCESAIYRCSSCGSCRTAEQYERFAKCHHGLMSWAIYLHIAYGLSGSAIGGMLEEFFGLAFSRQEIHVFKNLMARRYRSTYRRLLAKLVAGRILHADETEIRLKSGKAYVWVFASLEDVVFIQRPTREGEFLREVLKGFDGVLISDFYSAYESLECPQQKCLIHLIRDINQGLLDALYDQELRFIAEQFGYLLRSVIATVDERGLKRRYLARHSRRIKAFFIQLSDSSFRSEDARALQKRLLKSQNKLFTFIRHDGVPWNNNTAENAIKHFAYYRADTAGLMKESGLDDYLVLLSLYMSRRYKGVSFLKFLLSKSRDIDGFRARPRKRRRPTAIEQYPKGFDSRGPTTRRKPSKVEMPTANR